MPIPQHGASVDLPSKKGATPLALAAAAGQRDAVHALLQLDADPSRLNESGVAPIELAAANGHTEVVTMLAVALKESALKKGGNRGRALSRVMGGMMPLERLKTLPLLTVEGL